VSRTRQCATVTTRTPRHREFRKRPSVVVRFSSRWDFRPIRRKILNFSATRREATRGNDGFAVFGLRLVAPFTQRTRRPRRVRCMRRGREGGDDAPITALSAASRSVGGADASPRLAPPAGHPGFKSGCRSHPLSPPGAAIRVAASSAGHRAPARGGSRRAPPRACASRAPRCDRTNPSRCPRTPTAVP